MNDLDKRIERTLKVQFASKTLNKFYIRYADHTIGYVPKAYQHLVNVGEITSKFDEEVTIVDIDKLLPMLDIMDDDPLWSKTGDEIVEFLNKLAEEIDKLYKPVDYNSH